MRVLVVGGTGFIGRTLVRHLSEQGHKVRVLVRPGRVNPRLPVGVPVEVALTSLRDAAGLRAAMRDVEVVYHLAGGEWQATQSDLGQVDVAGTEAICQAAAAAGVQRLVYVSHLGADPEAAFPVLRAKGLAERLIRRAGVPYTILRSAIVFGPEDGFTTTLALLLVAQPGFFLLPGSGNTLLQPLWHEDLAAVLALTPLLEGLVNRTLEVGGPEQLPFRQIVATVAQALGLRRLWVPVPPLYLRWLTIAVQGLFPGLPLSTYFLDYLSRDRVCPVDILPREFGLLPERFAHRLDYLRTTRWRRALWARLLRWRR